MDILNIILPIVYIVVGLALIWFVVELALTIRKARSTVGNVEEQIRPTLANVEKITTDVKPIVEKVDPLMNRVQLTVDAANLEIMRVDEILSDVSQITNTASKATNAVDNVVSAPMDLVTSITNKVRAKFGPKGASDESIKLGEEKSAGDAPKNLAGEVVDMASDIYVNVKEQRDERKAQAESQAQKRQDRSDGINAAADKVNNAMMDGIDADV